MKSRCLCGNELNYDACCGRFIEKNEAPQTALELMRSRYSAYVLKKGQYLHDTCSKHLQVDEEIEEISEQKIEWLGLKIVESSENMVTFMAYYKENGRVGVMKERSFFTQEAGMFKYDRGELLKAEIARNESCPCQSGKKFKRCCG
jgi:SEC-C motif-containing protein